MILAYFETERGRGVHDGLQAFFNLTLADGREQEYLDRLDQICRDLGPDMLGYSTQVYRFHEACLWSSMMADPNKKWREAAPEDHERSLEYMRGQMER